MSIRISPETKPSSVSSDESSDSDSVNINIFKSVSKYNDPSETCPNLFYTHQLTLYMRNVRRFRSLEDSSNSEANGIMPSSEKTSKCSISCNCLHFNQVIINEVINSTPQKIFEAIYDDSSKFLSEIAKRKNMHNLRLSEKTKNDDGSFFRYIFHNLPNAFLGRTARNTSRVTFVINDALQQHFAVTYINETDSIPFANTFIVHMRLCLYSIEECKTNIKVSWHIEFIKNIWDVTKTIITKRSMAISQDIMGEYVILLHQIFGNNSENENHEFSGDYTKLSRSSNLERFSSNKSVSSRLPCRENIKLVFSVPFAVIIVLGFLIFLLMVIVKQQYQIKNLLNELSRKNRS